MNKDMIRRSKLLKKSKKIKMFSSSLKESSGPNMLVAVAFISLAISIGIVDDLLIGIILSSVISLELYTIVFCTRKISDLRYKNVNKKILSLDKKINNTNIVNNNNLSYSKVLEKQSNDNENSIESFKKLRESFVTNNDVLEKQKTFNL